MVGPAPTSTGGMAAVIASYINHWDDSRYSLKFVSTWSSHRSSIVKRCVQAAKGWLLCGSALLSSRPDIVHIHFTHRGSFFRKAGVLALTRALTSAKIILHCHSSEFASFYEARGTLLRAFVRRTLSSADLNIVVAGYWGEYFSALDPGITPLVVYNPVDIPDRVPAQGDREQAILTLGALGHRKGTYDILRAVPTVLAACPRARFWLGGDGDVEAVAGSVAAAPWGSSVHLLNWIEGREKDGYLDRAAVFLLPSYAEGLPVAVLEAMAHGLAVITTPVGGIPEAIERDQTGVFVQPGDVSAIASTCIELLKDEDRRVFLATNARRRALEQFDASRIMAQVYEVYDGLLSRSQTRSTDTIVKS